MVPAGRSWLPLRRGRITLAAMFTLRPATADDLPFARALYFDTMRYITDQLPGFDEAAHAARFAERFLLDEVRIVVRDGGDIGWLQVGESGQELFLKQMFIDPAVQRQGIGSALLRDLLARGRNSGKVVRLAVVKINPAAALYKRHGFVTTSEDAFKFHMERWPERIDVNVRPMRPEDARAFLEVHHASVRGLAAADYPPAVIEAWAPMPVSDASIANVAANPDNEVRIVAEAGGTVLGLGVLIPEKRELRACYVSPAAARRGVGTALVRELERIARAHGVAALRLNSSLSAEPFYRALGYTVHGRGEHRLRGTGPPMACVKMEKRLLDAV
jgi:putative acetyltransferase